jgi:glucosamine--fructose-6-phosphate aminotransferase (isomerizing)
VERLNRLRGDTLVLTDAREAETRDLAARFIRLPAGFKPRGPVRDLYTPIPYIVPAQLFAAHLSAHKGLDPDRPRALNKVTLTM